MHAHADAACCRPNPASDAPPQSWLGFLIMVLLVVYHFVTCDPKFDQQSAQQQ